MQHVHVKEKVKKEEVIRFGNWNFTDRLASVDIQETSRIGVTRTEICAGVLFKEIFKSPSFKYPARKVFLSRKDYRHKSSELLERSIKFIMNSLFGDTIRKNIDYMHEFKLERWTEPESDDRVEEKHKL